MEGQYDISTNPVVFLIEAIHGKDSINIYYYKMNEIAKKKEINNLKVFKT